MLGTYQAVDVDVGGRSRLDESVDGVHAVVVVVGALDLEGDAVLPRVAQLVGRHSSFGIELRAGRLDGGVLHSAALLVVAGACSDDLRRLEAGAR